MPILDVENEIEKRNSDGLGIYILKMVSSIQAGKNSYPLHSFSFLNW